MEGNGDIYTDDKWVTYGMCRHTDHKKKAPRRWRGLKNPTILWLICFALTFALTILPAGLAEALAAGGRRCLSSTAFWRGVINGNLYPMIITQSVVTMVQNFSASHFSKEERKTRQFAPSVTWTLGLALGLIFYIIVYLILVYAAPPWRDRGLYVISGLIAAVGLGSVWQLDREQNRIRKAREGEWLEEMRSRKDGSLYGGGRTFGFEEPPAGEDAASPPSGEDAGAGASDSEEPVVK